MTAGSQAPEREPVLSVRRMSKSFDAVRALKEVDLDLYAGEVLGLVGDNGAGKTTLVKCVAGTHRPDEGEIYVDGRLQQALTPDVARELGIETVHQNLSLVDTLDVVQNFFLNRELTARNPVGRLLRWLNRRRMYADTQAALDSLEVRVGRIEAPVRHLSGGQRQMVAVARAVNWGTHIVMMDEPAAALGVEQSLRVLEFVRRLAYSGIAVLFISHNMQHVLQATDRIVVLRHGEKVGDLRTKETTVQEVVTLITGAELVVPGQDVAV